MDSLEFIDGSLSGLPYKMCYSESSLVSHGELNEGFHLAWLIAGLSANLQVGLSLRTETVTHDRNSLMAKPTLIGMFQKSVVAWNLLAGLAQQKPRLPSFHTRKSLKKSDDNMNLISSFMSHLNEIFIWAVFSTK